MNFRHAVAALAAATLFACGPQNIVEDTDGIAESDLGVSHDEARGKKPAAIPMKVGVSATQGGVNGTTFSINATADLYFPFDMPSTKKGSHVARYEFTAPNGSMYQVETVAFAAGIAPMGNEISADIISGGYRIYVSMPVAGTMIQMFNYTGRWTVRVFLDDASVASATYTLTN